MELAARARLTQWPIGFAIGAACGVAVWVVYFVQASVFDGLFWDVFVLPVLGVVALASLAAAARSRTRRRWWFGFAGGAVLMVPVAVLVFILLFAILGLA
ncbi:hypothetical protein [Nocardioides cavernaquae]|uniref:Uncharacterized protein n=1 Tax=Nocardioides cavernaquae TaxID=2321396 RepID=A0A3A5HBI9_9ACTN|nr:hypothetical protein [Nocardioides cavernaquae]RJS47471.1 hypothetical protein D4739_15460 [Nocardioides cavernaquae]